MLRSRPTTFDLRALCIASPRRGGAVFGSRRRPRESSRIPRLEPGKPHRALVILACLISLGCSSRLVAEDIPRAKDAPTPLSPEESRAKIRLPDDLRLDIIASEPLVADPTAVCWDEHGRLFVCELHGYNLEGHFDVVELNKTGKYDRTVRRISAPPEAIVRAKKEQHGSVKLLEDEDGDGRMDRARVWADDLPPCFGVVPARGGVIVVCAPEIVYLSDTDGDGDVDERETLFTGLGVGKLERGINNPRWGVDNWIYVANGGAASNVTGPRLDGTVSLGRQIFRFRPDGSAIEPVTGQVDTFGLTMTDYDEIFVITTGDHCRYTLPFPWRYLRRNPHVPIRRTVDNAMHDPRIFPISKPHPWRLRRSQDPRWVRFYGAREASANGWLTSACGQLIYRADQLPRKYHGSHFACDPQRNIVRQSILRRDGAGFRASRAAGEEKREFLASSDGWFRPINLVGGPDGAIWIVDMYREIIEYYDAIPRFLQQQYGLDEGLKHGRLWRLSAKDGDVARIPTLAALSNGELVEQLEQPNDWHRLTAQRLLVERGAIDVANRLRARLRDGGTPTARLHALHTLAGLSKLTPDDVRRALEDTEPGVRVHALRLAETWIDDENFALDSLVDDPDARVRLQLALTLGERRKLPGRGELVRLAHRHGSERWMDIAILSSLTADPAPFLEGLVRGTGVGDKPPPLIRQTAAIVGSQRTGSAIGSVLRALVEAPEAQRVERQRSCLAGLVEGIRRRGALRLDPNASAGEVEKLLASDDTEVRQHALELAGLIGLAESAVVMRAYRSLSKRVLDLDRDLESRRAAMRLLSSAPFGLVDSLAEGLLNARHPLDLQREVIASLAKHDDPRVGERLLERWPVLTPRVQQLALEALLAQQNRIPTLLDGIESGSVPGSTISEVQREGILRHADAKTRKRASRLLGTPTTSAESAAILARYVTALDHSRDAARGKTLFSEHCAKCHRLDDIGHAVGPDLFAARNRADRALLVEILSPSRRIAAGYDTYTAIQKNGRTFTGVIVSESPTSVTIRWASGEETTLLRRDVQTIRAVGKSLMPDRVDKSISPEDMADLVAYLRGIIGDPVKTRRYEHDAVKLVGKWETERNPEYSGGRIAALTTTHGDSATLTFDGVGVRWIGAKTFNGGVFQWKIDSGTPGEVSGEVDTYIRGVKRFTTVVLTEKLKPGKHTIRIEMKSGTEIYLDALEVLEPVTR